MGESDPDDMMKIMIATDNHIGYMEKDIERCNDSLEAFEEVLRIAKEQDVDFILLGGDLFHDNNPSRQVLHKTMELFRHYCMGSRPCSIELRSDPSVNFQHSKFPVVNYEDPNYNISIPVFMIHGNHDDPAGDGNLSAVDILDVSNFINYFGKATDIEDVQLSPVLLQKGNTKLALYGLGSCKDERLHRMWRKGKVKFSVPTAEEGDWFNLLVLHQNRAKHGATNYIPASFIPDFFDLVFWGHEHECLIEPQFVPTTGETEDGGVKGVYITQPGSSVATSLSPGEQKQKHVGILYIKSDLTFKIEPIPLLTVRPFVMDGVRLKDTGIHPLDQEGVEKYLMERITNMADQAVAENTANDKLPLVRLKVDYNGGYIPFNWARFSERFTEKLANPKNILQWHRQRDPTTLGNKKKEDRKESNEFSEHDLLADTDQLDISCLLQEEVKKDNLTLLSTKNLIETLSEYVDHSENEAILDCLKFSVQKSQEFLHSRPTSSDKDIEKQIDEHREQLSRLQETEGAEAFKENLSIRRQKRLEGEDDFADPAASDPESDDDGSHVKEKPKTAATGRGRGSRGGRGRGSRGGGSGRGSRGGSSSTRGGRGSRGKKNAESAATAATSVTPSTPGVAVAASPSLTFSSGGATKSSQYMSQSRLTGKRPMSYLDPDSRDETSFSASSKPAKKAKSADKSLDVDMVDLTQSDDDDDFFFTGGSGTSTTASQRSTTTTPHTHKANPFHGFSGVRAKKK